MFLNEGGSGQDLACHRHSTGVCQLGNPVIKPKAGFYSVPNHYSRQNTYSTYGVNAHLVLFSEAKMPQRHLLRVKSPSPSFHLCNSTQRDWWSGGGGQGCGLCKGALSQKSRNSGYHLSIRY